MFDEVRRNTECPNLLCDGSIAYLRRKDRGCKSLDQYTRLPVQEGGSADAPAVELYTFMERGDNVDVAI